MEVLWTSAGDLSRDSVLNWWRVLFLPPIRASANLQPRNYNELTHRTIMPALDISRDIRRIETSFARLVVGEEAFLNFRAVWL
jgi:hypothetical protein